jgi:NADH-ubiquinone oxidoreductase chain 5
LKQLFLVTSVLATFAFVLGVSGAFLTAFYSMRLLFLAFLTKPRGYREVYMHAHEPGIFMLLPLMLLVLGAIFVGFIFKDMFVGLGSDFFGNLLNFDVINGYSFFASEFSPAIYKQLPFFNVVDRRSSLYNLFSKNDF